MVQKKDSDIGRILSCSLILDSCSSRPQCTSFMGQCWCYSAGNKQPRHACGHALGYKGKYTKLSETGRPRDVIIAMGLSPNPNSCKNNDFCVGNCQVNRCNDYGCYGSTGRCVGSEWEYLPDSQSDLDQHPNLYLDNYLISRCTNYEGKYSRRI